jgi:hypothetical protein
VDPEFFTRTLRQIPEPSFCKDKLDGSIVDSLLGDDEFYHKYLRKQWLVMSVIIRTFTKYDMPALAIPQWIAYQFGTSISVPIVDAKEDIVTHLIKDYSSSSAIHMM